MSETHVSNTIFGFWLYLLTDCIMFATLFAAYFVLQHNTYGGPHAKELFSPSFALVQTLLFLLSTFTCGLAMTASHKKGLIFWYGVTFFLGLFFMAMEMHQFQELLRAGNSWQQSAFLSAFFTLVATHGVHVLLGLLWIIVLLVPVIRKGLTEISWKRLTCLKLFWQFLNLVWVVIFTMVYL